VTHSLKKIVPLLIVAFFLHACDEEKTTTQTLKPTPLRVATITVEKKNIPIWARYTGRTRASNTQEVKARVAGVLEKRYFHDGDLVHKGEKLFKIQQDEYLATLHIAQAQLLQDQAQLKLAQADVKRYQPLVKEGLAPRATLEQYEAKKASLEAAIIADKANIKQAKLNLSYTIIKAPITGKISARYVDVGNLVGPGNTTLLTTIVKADPIYAYFSPSQSDVRMFTRYKDSNKPYAFVELANALNPLRLNGYVDFQNNTVDPLTSTISMRAVIKNPNYTLLPGSFVYVHLFISDKHPFLMIPPEVIFNDQLGKFVYIVKNNKLQRVNITTGYSSKYYIAVTKGLHDGDKLVVSALMKLKPNLEVQTTDVTQEKGIDAILKKNNLIPTQE
jgi:RND family efflux transporter MFP subunit